MRSTSDLVKRRAGVAVAALLAALGAWLLLSSPENPEVDLSLPADVSTVTTTTTTTPNRLTEAVDVVEADHPRLERDDVRRVEATGRMDPVVDIEREDALAAVAYSERIEANIALLEHKAEVARRDGLEALAELMDKRVAALERRLREHEEDVAARD